ncbi:MAG TPA: efflux RND transporter periplasmic adaptor subunit, partial [Polyangiaceae bacterium]|nr:efflux RND transporter periplasmic adaptor subunit [Polyangiaceae bacterium]
MADDLSQNLASLKIDRSAPRPPASKAKWVWLSAFVVVGALGVTAWPILEATLFKTPVSVTEVVSVSPAQASVQLTAAGYVQANRTSRIAPKVPGRVLQV